MKYSVDKSFFYSSFYQMKYSVDILFFYSSYYQMKYSVDEPSVSTSFKEKMEEKTEETEIKEKDEIIARLKGTL